ETLLACGERLISHGGHAAAACCKIPPSYLEDFRERVRLYSRQKFVTPPSPTCLTIDAEVPLEFLTAGLVEALSRLEPYGAGNPRPLFLAGPVSVVGAPRGVGRGDRHLRFGVQQNRQTFPSSGFNLCEPSE